MMNLDIIPEGWHGFSGFCDCEIKDEYNDDVINGIVIQLDGKNYRCYEDPSDGYRSYSEVQETDQECMNTFPPQRVMVKHYDRSNNHGIEVYNPDFELILRVGTDNYDDYYPMAVWEWHPENLPINKGIHKKEYEMPGELTMKIKEKITTPDTSVGEIIDTVDQYYRAAYARGRMDFVKRLEEAIGSLHEFGETYNRFGDYVTALENVIEEIQNVDPSFKKY